MNNLTAIPYAQGRDQVQDGDLIFVADKKGILVPRLIRWSTKSLFSHVAIAFWIDTAAGKRLMAVQAQGGNSRFIQNVSALENCELYVVPGNKAWIDVAPIALVKLGQVSYGWSEALYVGTREFFLTRFNLKLPEKDFTGQICSEFVATVEGFTDVYISPQVLFEEATKTKAIRVILSN